MVVGFGDKGSEGFVYYSLGKETSNGFEALHNAVQAVKTKTIVSSVIAQIN
jgi:hypothetical protein